MTSFCCFLTGQRGIPDRCRICGTSSTMMMLMWRFELWNALKSRVTQFSIGSFLLPVPHDAACLLSTVCSGSYILLHYVRCFKPLVLYFCLVSHAPLCCLPGATSWTSRSWTLDSADPCALPRLGPGSCQGQKRPK